MRRLKPQLCTHFASAHPRVGHAEGIDVHLHHLDVGALTQAAREGEGLQAGVDGSAEPSPLARLVQRSSGWGVQSFKGLGAGGKQGEQDEGRRSLDSSTGVPRVNRGAARVVKQKNF